MLLLRGGGCWHRRRRICQGLTRAAAVWRTCQCTVCECCACRRWRAEYSGLNDEKMSLLRTTTHTRTPQQGTFASTAVASCHTEDRIEDGGYVDPRSCSSSTYLLQLRVLCVVTVVAALLVEERLPLRRRRSVRLVRIPATPPHARLRAASLGHRNTLRAQKTNEHKQAFRVSFFRRRWLSMPFALACMRFNNPETRQKK
jgi:hypothetical protein